MDYLPKQDLPFLAIWILARDQQISKKKEELAYKQGNLAVLVFDNQLARDQWQITPLMKDKFAQWARKKLPLTSFKRIIWKNDLKYMQQIKPKNETHAREDFLYF